MRYKLMLVYLVLFLALSSLCYASTFCYQESYNTFNQTSIDNNCTQNYNGTFLESKSTYSANLYINYTKPNQTFSDALWQVKYSKNSNAYNISIPDECFDESKLSLKLYLDYADTICSVRPNCYNGSTWVEIGRNVSSSRLTQGNVGSNYLTDGDWSTVSIYSYGWKDTSGAIGCDANWLYDEALWWYNDTSNPVVSLVSPSNNTYSNNLTQTFTCNITDDIQVANLSLYIWNSSNNILIGNGLSGGREPWDTVTVTSATGGQSSIDDGDWGTYAWGGSGNPINATFETNVCVGGYTNITLIYAYRNTRDGEQVSNLTCYNGTSWIYVTTPDSPTGGATQTDTVSLPSSCLSNSNVKWRVYLKDSPYDVRFYESNYTYICSDSKTNLSGTSNQTNWTVTLPKDDTYKWNCLGYDTFLNSNWSTNNYTLTVDTTKPTINFTSPTEIDYSSLIRNYIYANVTISDTNYNRTNISLWNSTGAVYLSKNAYFVNSTPLNQTNFTNLIDGVYFINATTYDYAGNTNKTETRRYLLDTHSPINTFLPATVINNSNWSRNWIYADINSLDNLYDNIKNQTIYLYNNSGYVDSYTEYHSSDSYCTNDCETNHNFTSLLDGIYYINATSYDWAGNYNYSETRKITLDTTKPTINFTGSNTYTNNSNWSRNWINITVTISDINYNRTNLTLWNLSGYVNGSTSNSTNFTNLADGLYYINATTYDYAGNTNKTETRQILLDTHSPQIAFMSSTEINNSNWSRTWIYANFSVNDTLSYRKINITLWNTTGVVSSVENTNNITNFTSLPNGIYFLNATAYDYAGNTNNSETRRYVLDTTNPTATLSSPATGTITKNTSVNLTATLTDNLGVKNATLYVHNSSGNLQYSNSTSFTNGTTLTLISFVNNFASGFFYWFYNLFDWGGQSYNTSNYTFQVDTITPTIDFGINVEGNNTNWSRNYIYANFTIIDMSWNSTNITLWNITALVNSTSANYTNYTNLRDGTYYLNATTYDNATHSNSTTTRMFTLDTTYPLINFTAITVATNNSNFSRNYIYSNVTVSDLNYKSINTTLYNSSGLVTSNSSGNASNFTSLPDGRYYLNVTTLDYAGNTNKTETREYLLDTTKPTVNFSIPTEADDTFWNRTWINVNISTSDTNFNRTNTTIWNSTGFVNSTASNLTNFTNLMEGVYYINVTVYDLVGNYNSTETRRITLDRTSPTATLIAPPNASVTTNTTMNFSVNLVDEHVGQNQSGIKNSTLYVYNTSGLVITEQVCYQETANVSTACALSAGNYAYTGSWTSPENLTDGNWANNATVTTTAPGVDYFYINYTIPNNTRITGTYWQVRTPTAGYFNLSINSSCWNITSDKLQLRIAGQSLGWFGLRFQCMNDTEWVNMTSTIAEYKVKDEAMYWNISLSDSYAEYTPNTYIGNIIELIEGVYNWFYKLWDWAGNFYQTGNRTLTVDTNAPTAGTLAFVNFTNKHSFNVSVTFTDLTGFNFSTIETSSGICSNLSNLSYTGIKYNCTGTALASTTIRINATDILGHVGSSSQVVTNYPNKVPTMSGAVLNKTSNVTELDALYCNATGAADVDSDTTHYHYEWYKNTVAQGLDSTNTTVGNLTPGEIWYCEAWASDSYENSSKYSSSSVLILSSSAVTPASATIYFTNATTALTGIISNSTFPTNNNSWINFSVQFTDPNPNDNWTTYICNTSNVANCMANTSASQLCRTTIANSTCGYYVAGVGAGTKTYYAIVLDNTSLSSSLSGTFEVNHFPDVPTYVSPTEGNISVNYTSLNFSSSDLDSDTINYTIYNSTDLTIWSVLYSGSQSNYTWQSISDGYKYIRASTRDQHWYNVSLNSSIRTLLIDTTAPNSSTVILLSPPNNSVTTNTTMNFTANLSDNLGVKNATLYIYNTTLIIQNSTSYNNGTIQIIMATLNNLADGIMNWFLTVFDWGGNSYTSENRTLTVDTNAPTAGTLSFTNFTNKHSFNVSVTFTDLTGFNFSTIETSSGICSNLSNLSYTGIKYNCSGTALASTTIRINATDILGHVGSSSQVVTNYPNKVPTMTGAELNKTSGVTDADSLNCTATGAADADSDATHYHYEWYKNTVAQGIDQLDITVGNLTTNDVWYCEAWVSDTYQNSSRYTSTQVGVGLPDTAPVVLYTNATTAMTGIISNSTFPTNNNSWINISVNFTDVNGANNTWTVYACNTSDTSNCLTNPSSYQLCKSANNITIYNASCQYNVATKGAGNLNYYVFVLDNSSLKSSPLIGSYEVNHFPDVPTYVSPTEGNISVNYTSLNFSSSDLDSDTINYTIYNSTDLTIWSVLYSGSQSNYTWQSISDGYKYIRASTRDQHWYNVSLNSSIRTLLIDSTGDGGGNPNVTLLSPPNNSITTNTTFNFTANLTDDYGIKNATLYVYNTTLLYTNSTSYNNGTTQIIMATLNNFADGIITWFISLFDWAGNTYTTENRTLTVDTNAPTAGTLTFVNFTNKHSFNVSVTFTDLTGFNFSTIEINDFCYQESANVSACDGSNTGSYRFASEATLGYFYVNYTKPLGASSMSLWQVKHGESPTYNVSIPLSCFNYYNSSLYLRFYSVSDWPTATSYGQCYNGSWNTITSVRSASITGSTLILDRTDYATDGNWADSNSGIGFDRGSQKWSIGNDNNIEESVIIEEAMWWSFSSCTNLSNSSYTGIKYNCTGKALASTTIRINATDILGHVGSSSQVVTNYPNKVPTMSSAELNQTSSVTDLNSLLCNATGAADVDSDATHYHYEWYKNTVAQGIDSSELAKGSLTPGENWYCEAWVSDSYENSSKYSSSSILVSGSSTAPAVLYTNATTALTGLISNSTFPTNNNSWINISVNFTDPNINNNWTVYICTTPNAVNCIANTSGVTMCKSPNNISITNTSCRFDVAGKGTGTIDYYAIVIDNTALTSSALIGHYEVNHQPTIPTRVSPINSTTNWALINFTSSDLDSDIINYTIFNSSDNINFYLMYSGNESNITWRNLEIGTYYLKAYTTDQHGYSYSQNSTTYSFIRYRNINTFINNVSVLAYYGTNLTIQANVTDDYDTILRVNFTLVAPSGIKINDINGTHNGDLWNSTFWAINETGVWTYNLTSTDNDDSNTTISIFTGTFTIDDTEDDIIIDTNNIETPFQLGRNQTKTWYIGIKTKTPEDLLFNLSDNLDLSNFTTGYNMTSLYADNSYYYYFKFNISANSSSAVANYTGNISIIRNIPFYNLTLIPIHLEVTNYVGDIELDASSSYTFVSCPGTVTHSYKAVNNGNYQVTNCHPFLLDEDGEENGISADEGFTVAASGNKTFLISYSYGGAEEEIFTLDVRCTATPSGTNDTLSNIKPQITFSPGTGCSGGAPTSGGGGGPSYKEPTAQNISMGNATAFCNNDNKCISPPETPWNCPNDCLQLIWEYDKIFCLPIFQCGNWLTSWFINVVILIILLTLGLFYYQTKKVKRKI